MRHTVYRDRRGRGIRGPIIPQSIPRYKTRSSLFDAYAIDAYEPLRALYPEELATVDLAVDVAPRMRIAGDVPPDIIADGAVPLGRFIPAGVDHRGAPTRARLVLFRKPIEKRCANTDPRNRALTQRDFMRWILTRLVAEIIGVDATDIEKRLRT